MPSELKGRYTVAYENNGGGAVIEPIFSDSLYSARGANVDVRPAGEVTDTYPEYMYKEVSTRLVYSSLYARYLDMSIKDSMYSYTQTSKKSYAYDAGTLLSVIAGTLKIASGTLIGSLTGLVTVVGGLLKLSASVNYYFSESYKFYALRQAYIYDYTYNERDVSVHTDYGTGEISMTWDQLNGEYIDPEYRITALAHPHTISYDTLYENAKNTWEFNMEEYGYWKWGDV